MGAGIAKEINGVCDCGSFSSSKPSLGDIPEGCLSSIFMYLDPPEICKLAGLNRGFRNASWSDFVWESKLPSNYKFLVHKLFDESPDKFCKKYIFARLCRPIQFDGGTKEVWLDKNSGETFLAVSSKALKITGIDDRRYWSFSPTDESRFNSVAYLKQIWWVEIQGELEFEFPPGRYSVYFRIQLGKPSKRFGRRIAELGQVHGWDIKPVRFQLSTSNGQHASSECYLTELGNWMHCHVGDFVVENLNSPIRLKFSMIQIDCTHIKGGLCVDSVLVNPSDFKQRSKQI